LLSHARKADHAAGRSGKDAVLADEAGSIDYKPTDTQMQVLAEIEKELAATKAAFDKIESSDIPAFNKANTGKLRPIGNTVSGSQQ